MGLTEQKFSQGMSTQQYIDQIKVNSSLSRISTTPLRFQRRPKNSSIASRNPSSWQFSPLIGVATP